MNSLGRDKFKKLPPLIKGMPDFVMYRNKFVYLECKMRDIKTGTQQR